MAMSPNNYARFACQTLPYGVPYTQIYEMTSMEINVKRNA